MVKKVLRKDKNKTKKKKKSSTKRTVRTKSTVLKTKTKKKATKKRKVDKETHTNTGACSAVSDPPLRTWEKYKQDPRPSNSPFYQQWPPWGEQFLIAYEKVYTQTLACDSVRISHDTMRRYARGCKEFRNAVDSIKYRITDLLEQSCLKRAVNGTDEVIVQGGQVVHHFNPATGKFNPLPMVKKKWETSLSIFMLKGRRREDYYPENHDTGGTADDKAAAVREAILEMKQVMMPPPNWEDEEDK